MRDHVPALLQPASLGQWPELLEIALSISISASSRARPEPRLAVSSEIVALAAQPDLTIRAGREIALLDLIGLGAVQFRRLGDEELALDLHLDTVD